MRKVFCVKVFVFFFFNDTATTEIYTLSLHDALPIFELLVGEVERAAAQLGRVAVLVDDELAGLGDPAVAAVGRRAGRQDRKSTRLNSSHANISYAVFCLKKKNNQRPHDPIVCLLP